MTLTVGSGNDNLNKMQLGLRRIHKLLAYLGHPQEQLRIVHVAGTNGKGATVAFLRRICVEAGIRVGSFQSPAVLEPLEVIRIGESPISEQEHRRLCEKLEEAVAALQREEPEFSPSAFELQTAEAFCYFAEQRVELVLLETGLGGDEDATNAYTRGQLCSVITPIGLDHCQFLGETLEEIAAHKAGIMRKSCPVILGKQSEAVRKVLLAQATAMQCPVLEPDWEAVRISERMQDGQGTRFVYREESELICGLSGDFQVENAVCALEVVEHVLRPAGFAVSLEAIRRGLARVTWPGRFEILPVGQSRQLVVLDGAHNPAAAKRLAEAVETHFGDYRRLFVCGVLSDKDYIQVFLQMQSVMQGAQVLTLTPPGVRGLSAAALKAALDEIGLVAQETESVSAAAKQALAWLRGQSEPAVVVAFGSLSWLADFRAETKKEK